MGSLSLETNSCIRKSRIMKFVAQVSSSISKQSEPTWGGREGGEGRVSDKAVSASLVITPASIHPNRGNN